MDSLKSKIQSLMATPTLASFATITDKGNPWVRYVVVKSDEALNIYFATFAGSRKVAQIAANNSVHLTLGGGNPANPAPYLQVAGRAAILTDAASKKAVWYDHLENVFNGPDDPNYHVCQITPQRIEYTVPGPGNQPEVWEG